MFDKAVIRLLESTHEDIKKNALIYMLKYYRESNSLLRYSIRLSVGARFYPFLPQVVHLINPGFSLFRAPMHL